ncbi:class I SAM-dependent methyltransferase [Dyella lutea]|uniref:Class I SAM-dependent methyltransferase n=1 Tax=Dyella lutea TaxID=2950441 RepID=A0ABT1F6V6_9GAMM|nr:class I SAM-dependent methyltransferase [Dyella lutea]MCP1373119.1 class I SAM-dependent methyltransferase [Dyella lutea]
MDPNARFVVEQYAPRANDYVTSAVHAGGADLDQVEALLREHRPQRLLDLGCGGGHVSYRVAPLVAAVTACDPTPSMLDAVQAGARERGLANIAVQHAVAERLPFADGAFDALVARFTTHHWQDRDAGLREARRVLASDGLALFIDVVSPEPALLDSWLQTLELLRDVSHVRNYRVSEWTAALARAGFAIHSLTPRRLPLPDFGEWTARTRTPAAQVTAIRQLQQIAPAAVREHFAIAADGAFTLDTVTLVAHAV